MNQIEIWFGILVRKVIRRGNFASLADLQQKLEAFVDYFNRTMAKPSNGPIRASLSRALPLADKTAIPTHQRLQKRTRAQGPPLSVTLSGALKPSGGNDLSKRPPLPATAPNSSS